MTALNTLQGLLNRILRITCVSLSAMMVLLVIWQVFTRFVLASPSAWTEEAAIYTFVWVSMLGMAIAVSEKADIVMDFLVARLPRSGQRVADLLAYSAALLFVLYVMVYGGIRQSAMTWEKLNPLLPLTQGQLYLAIPAGGSLIALFIMAHMLRTLSPAYAERPRTLDALEETTS